MLTTHIFVRSNLALFISFFCLILFPPILSSQIAINELMASNQTSITDSDGDNEDWIELYNFSSDPVNIGGWHISDDPFDNEKWTFPSITINPGEFLIVWASGKDQVTPELHTNFSISSQGEDVYITNNFNTIIDNINPTTIPQDISYGKSPDGQGSLYFFASPTPGSSNVTTGFEEILEAPVFSHETGLYENEFYLEINHIDPTVSVYYTLDGSKPTTSDLLYTQPILIYNRKHDENQISAIPTTPLGAPSWYRWFEPMDTVFKGTCIRAKAFKNNCFSRDIVTKTYFVDEDIEERYNIPIVTLAMDESDLLGSSGIYTNYNSSGINWERDVHFSFIDTDGTIGSDTDAGIRVHGGNSRRYALKSFRLYFRQTYGDDNINYPIFPEQGMNVHDRIILRNGGGTWSRVCLRDGFSQTILNDFSDVDRQAFRPSIVFVNGEYWGVMNIRERFDDNYIENTYNIEGNLDMLKDVNSVDYGSNTDYTALRNFLSTNTLNDPSNYDYVEQQMDIENFIDYHILQVFTMNTDQPGKNARWWRSEELDNKWRWMWYDLDDVFKVASHNPYNTSGLVFCVGLDSISDSSPNSAWSSPSWAPNGPSQTLPLRELLESDTVKVKFINRYADLLNTAFEPIHLEYLLDSLINITDPFMYEHYRRWHRPEPSFRDEHIDILFDFANNRQEFARSDIENFFELDGQYELDLDIASGDGHVNLNSLEIHSGFPTMGANPYPWNGIYYKNVPIQLEAIPAPGYVFSHWSGYIQSSNSVISVNSAQDAMIFAHFLEDTTINVDIEEQELNVTVYPNPFKDHLNIKLDDNIPGEKTISVFDISGRLHYSNKEYANEFSISTSSFHSGVYFLKIQTEEDKTITRKVIKN